MQIETTAIPGCRLISVQAHKDYRGSFTKPYAKEAFRRHGLPTEYAEDFFSVSKKNVLRGLHFQLPPHAHDKLVYCVDGTILDVVVDLRVGSPMFSRAIMTELDSDKFQMVLIPVGCAHGFYVLSESATTVYKVTTAHEPKYDSGIFWNSAGITWPCTSPIVSERDARLPTLHEFASPFRMESSHST